MRDPVRIKNVGELLLYSQSVNNLRERVNCAELDCKEIALQFASPVVMNAAIAIFVLSGTGGVCVNYKIHPVKAGTLVLLSASHLFCFDKCSQDLQCLFLLVSKEFMDEMDSTDMIYRRIRYGVKMYNTPVVELGESQFALLVRRAVDIDGMINNMDHLYRKEMVLNHLFAFYLDLSNILDHRPEFQTEGSLNRYESMIKSFIELLVTHYRTEHKVEFYASQLHVSAHYLTLIVKRFTGQSVCDFIFEMLYSEARNLLIHSKLSVQEITTVLNFSDQSSFGKFFKRKAGVSPVDYRKSE